MMILRFIFLSFSAILTVFPLFASAQTENPAAKILVPCPIFHDGTFEYTNGDRQGIKIVRKGAKQVESNPVNGEISTFKVKWTEDCVCERTFKKSNMPSRYSQLAKGGRVVTIMDTIIITSEDFYEYKEVRFGVKNYAAVKKILTKKEVAKRKSDLEKKIREDSLAITRAAKALADSVIQDSVNKAKGIANAEKEKKAREDAASKKNAENKTKPDPGAPVPAKKEEKPGKPEKKGKEEKSEIKEKPAKPEKEKKEKEEKPAKPEKEKKEKEEKPAKPEKEKKEK